MSEDIEYFVEQLNQLEPQLAAMTNLQRTARLAELAGHLRGWQDGNSDALLASSYEVRGLFGRIGRLASNHRCDWVVALHHGASIDWGLYRRGMADLAVGITPPVEFWEEHIHGLESVVDDAVKGRLRAWLVEASRVVPKLPALRRLSQALGVELERRDSVRRKEVQAAILAERERCARHAEARGLTVLAEELRRA